MEAALAYLSRFASTRKNLERHLRRKFVPPEEGDLGVLLEACLARLEELGLLNDARYAEDRARGLRAQGKSRRAIRDRLAQKGVETELVDEALRAEDEDAELLSAIRHARRRRLGPFRTAAQDERRELAVMARAGFSFGVAKRVLSLELSDAEAMLVGR